MKYPRKSGYVWEIKQSPKYLRKKNKYFELSAKKTKHLKTTWTGYKDRNELLPLLRNRQKKLLKNPDCDCIWVSDRFMCF